MRGFLSPQTTLFQYTHGVADVSLVSPDGRSLDDIINDVAGELREGMPESKLHAQN